MTTKSLEMVVEAVGLGELVKVGKGEKSGYTRLLECKIAQLEAKNDALLQFIGDFINKHDVKMEQSTRRGIECFGGRQYVEVHREARSGDVVTFDESFTPNIIEKKHYPVVPTMHDDSIVTECQNIVSINSFSLQRRTAGMKVYELVKEVVVG